MGWGGAEGEGEEKYFQADSLLNLEPNTGLDHMTLKPWPENQESYALPTEPPRHPSVENFYHFFIISCLKTFLFLISNFTILHLIWILAKCSASLQTLSYRVARLIIKVFLSFFLIRFLLNHAISLSKILKEFPLFIYLASIYWDSIMC